jgi:protein-S-isoprenylcysteine O-methyltransferase Ste14
LAEWSRIVVLGIDIMTNSLSIYSWITMGLWCVLIIYIVRGARTANAEIEHPARMSVFSRVLKIVGMLYLFALIYFPRSVGIPARPMAAHHLGRDLAGVVLCAAGVALVIASRRALGRSWSDLVVLKNNHELIQRGPYRWMRHPLYSGMLLAILGSAITVNTRVAYLAVPVVLFGFWVKSRQEEALLEQHFSEYRQYRQRVKAFIPFVL